ncbi:hypothetical protein A4H97_32165 [Niastella yeongjuensis]|uniref:Uncharacterized protein n=1 Tax=Niastella yeongjuensis TaxID=354355 RepID=A0A1V9EID4_9BACT|nr:hypothetical protein [Niastella yeongjuensis]OQP45898.1 hypothetical protein A4H97_32165 [Niastella yeongjuensis]SEP46831.1 hypothetical protein SAMN05660816_06515 [Niastella yeongjuensis]
MNKVTVSYGQTWLDIALQELGDMERAIELALLNDRAITDDLQAGVELMVPDFDSDKRDIVRLFGNSANKPASGDTFIAASPDSIGEGIEFWALENDFVVS